MGIFEIALLFAAFLCSLVAGFLLAFAVVVMPGINALDDKAFIRSFQMIDRVIQNNQPIFLFIWVGSVVALLASTLFGIAQLDAAGRAMIVCAAILYFLGVQLPTIRINVPLNNKLKNLNVDAMDEAVSSAARAAFEPRWNLWNSIRTAVACMTSALLMIVLFRL